MPRKLTPSKQDLENYVRQGLTHEQIAVEHEKVTGARVARSSISAAIHRYGLAEHKHRYTDEIPWRLRGKDSKAYPIRMLRLLGKRRRGEKLLPTEDKRLDSWLRTMREENAVVAWDPDVEPSVFYVERADGDPLDIPIRVQRVWLKPFRY
jgi:hypothetical protein